MKRLADEDEPAVPIPLILGPVPVEVHAVVVAVDVRTVEVTVALHGRAATCFVQHTIRSTAH